MREASLLADLKHPAIVRYIAHGATPSGDPFLAMEWLEGEDLSHRLRKLELTMGETLALGTRIADALAVAHACGILHRDIKPPNLFLLGGDPAKAKLLDFGIARLKEGTPMETRTGMLLGTSGYIAPEQARGRKALDSGTGLNSPRRHGGTEEKPNKSPCLRASVVISARQFSPLPRQPRGCIRARLRLLPLPVRRSAVRRDGADGRPGKAYPGRSAAAPGGLRRSPRAAL